MKSITHISAIFLFHFAAVAAQAEAAAPAELDACNVVWTTPSKDAAGSMPLGNGKVGLNLWVEENGDLQFYISRSDSYSEISRLLKVGKVRVSIEPNPFKTGVPFKQELRLREGRCEITAGEKGKEVKLCVFVDAAKPVVHVRGESAASFKVKATVESPAHGRPVVANGGKKLGLDDARRAVRTGRIGRCLSDPPATP